MIQDIQGIPRTSLVTFPDFSVRFSMTPCFLGFPPASHCAPSSRILSSVSRISVVGRSAGELQDVDSDSEVGGPSKGHDFINQNSWIWQWEIYGRWCLNRIKQSQREMVQDVQVASELPESFCKQDSKGCNTCHERRPGFF